VLKDWRTQRHIDTRAEVAKEAMVAVFLLANFLTNRAKDMQPDNASAAVMNSFEERWGGMEGEEWDRMLRARALLEAYIPSVLEKVDALRLCGLMLRTYQSRLTGEYLGKHPENYDIDRVRAYGSVPRAEIAVLREKAKDALLDYASHLVPASEKPRSILPALLLAVLLLGAVVVLKAG
jgi:hypothetical protein